MSEDTHHKYPDFGTITIEIPAHLIYNHKEISSLTKTGAIAKRKKESGIKLIKSETNHIRIVNGGTKGKTKKTLQLEELEEIDKELEKIKHQKNRLEVKAKELKQKEQSKVNPEIKEKYRKLLRSLYKDKFLSKVSFEKYEKQIDENDLNDVKQFLEKMGEL